jgi:hypothetical protein
MNLISLFHIYAVVITLKNGFFSALKPAWVKNAPLVDPATSRAKTEMRSMWGGLYLGLGIAGLVYPVTEVYRTIAIVYIASNLVRIISMVINRTYPKSIFQTISYEIILTVFLFL